MASRGGLAACLTGLLAGWLAGWLGGRLANWPAGRLTSYAGLGWPWLDCPSWLASLLAECPAGLAHWQPSCRRLAAQSAGSVAHWTG